MSAAQIHLAFNHFPIAGSFFALIVLFWGLFAKKDQIKTVGIGILIISALGAIVVMQTGEGTEEIVEHKPGVTKHLIHEHEEAAEAAMIAIQLAAVLGALWIVLNKKGNSHQEKVLILTLIMNLAVTGLMAKAAHEGGKIRHDEIRSEASGAIPVVNSEIGEIETDEHEKNEKE